MNNTKLCSLLKTFSQAEICELELFVNSPFFISGKNYPTVKLTELMKIIRRHFPVNGDNMPSKENIFHEIYPGKKYSDQAIRNLFSYLKYLAEQYLVIKRFCSDSFEGNHFLLMELYERRLNREFEKKLKENYVLLEKQKRTADYYYNMFRTDDYSYTYYSGIAGYTPRELQNMIDNFHMFCVSRALQVFLPAINLQNVIKFSFNLPLYNEIIGHIESSHGLFKDNKRILIYYNLVQMLKTKEEEYYFSLKNLFRENYQLLEVVDRNNLFVCLGNFCLEKISVGDELFNSEKFENDKAYLKSGLIHEKRHFHVSLFLGIAMNALKLKEIKWTERFVEENSTFLAPEFMQFTENYIRAEILYAKSSPGEALKKLSVITSEIPYHKQLVRNLTLKIYCDLGYYSEAASLIETSRKFLNGNFGLDDSVKQDMILFLKFTNRLMNVKQMITKKNSSVSHELGIFKKELSDIRHFRNKDWLKEKAALLV